MVNETQSVKAFMIKLAWYFAQSNFFFNFCGGAIFKFIMFPSLRFRIYVKFLNFYNICFWTVA